MKRKRKLGLMLVQILGLFLALVWIGPFYIMVVNAFKTRNEIFSNVLAFPESVMFSNFVQAFISLDFVWSFMNSLLITTLSVGIIIIFSSMAGYALARNKSKLSKVIFFIFVAAMLIPFQTVMIPLVSIFGDINMLNRAGLIFMYLGFGCSLSIFLYHGAMTSIPKSLDEAAIVEGAKKYQVFWLVIFPLLKPISVTVGILNVIWIWNDFLLPSLVLGSSNATIPLRMFMFFGEYTREWHLALAGLTIAILPVVICYFFAQKQIIKGVSEGAIK